MKRTSLPVPQLLLALFLLLTLAGCSAAPSDTSDPPLQEPAASSQPSSGSATSLGSLQSFSAGTLDGELFTQEQLQDKDVTVLNVWALTCPPCIAELPDLAAFANALPDNIQLITLCLDGAGNEETLQTLLAEAGFQGATLISADGDLLDLCNSLLYTPTTLLADAGGNLVGDVIIGRQENLPEVYLDAVNRALADAGKAEVSLET
ncbi:MAG: TlpA family protein disulfide reductase [Oscillibacter sp.]|nr:TlpA family protein disulfide reductase [Oscillibacter sp.]